MNSINWPASSVWVFIAQLLEHCSANAEATGSNPFEATKNFSCFGLFRNCLNCYSTAMVTDSFHQVNLFTQVAVLFVAVATKVASRISVVSLRAMNFTFNCTVNAYSMSLLSTSLRLAWTYYTTL